MPQPKVLGYVVLTQSFEREGNKWVGTCVELGTSTYARSLDQCQQELKVLCEEHLNLLEQAGERKRFFEKWDVPFYEQRTAPEEVVIRRSSVADWDRLFRANTLETSGLFFQPHMFPLRGQPADGLIHTRTKVADASVGAAVPV